MWQHDLDTVCHFVLITARRLGSEQKQTPPRWSWICAAVLMRNSRVDVSCIGCHCTSFYFSLCLVQTWRHVSECTPTQKLIHTNKNTHTNVQAAALVLLWFGLQICRMILLYVSSLSLFCLDFKRFIILFVKQHKLCHRPCSWAVILKWTLHHLQQCRREQSNAKGKARKSMPTAHTANHVWDFCGERRHVGLEEVPMEGEGADNPIQDTLSATKMPTICARALIMHWVL